MSKNPLWMMALSAALMMGALVFGLYPETQAERRASVAPDRPGVQLALDEYQGQGGSQVDDEPQTRFALGDHIVDLGAAAYRRLTGS